MFERSLCLRDAVMSAIAVIPCICLVWAAGAQELTTHSITLSHAEVSHDPTTGQTVITMPSRGDLPGVLTVAVARNAAGTVTAGHWSLVVSYTQTTLATGEVVVDPPTDGEEDHLREGADALVQRGVLKGTVEGGTVSMNPDGTVQSLNDLVLSVSGGTLAYAGATSGNGVLSATNLYARPLSSGAASIIF